MPGTVKAALTVVIALELLLLAAVVGL